MKRFFIEKEKMLNDKTIIIDGDEFYHLSNVLRTKINEQVEICFNDGFVHRAVISKIEKKSAIAELVSKEISVCEPKVEISVFQAVSKNNKMDLITQKITELGAGKLIPFESEFAVVKGYNKDEKLFNVAMQASKQCGRAKIMEVLPVQKFDEILSLIRHNDLIIFANEHEKEKKLSDVFKLKIKPKKIAVVVGSEGGFSQEEIRKLTEAGAQSITLGNRILRCETAAITLVALVCYETGEFNK